MAGDSKYIARALVVDDEQAICDLLIEKLRSEGYECRACRDAEQALGLLRRESFDVILSDLRMPGISGMELMKRVQEESPRSAFLLVTGEQDVRVGIEAMKLGASDYVVKPFRLEPVLHSVTQALAKKRLEIELENYRQRLEQMVEERTSELENALRQIESTYEETLQALGAAIDLRDTGTAGHSFRVTQYALEIGHSMGCSAGELKEISHGASLHDIGKIGIPDGILLKEAILSDEERAVMKTHVVIGYHLVSRIAFLHPAAQIVRTHHENFDGSGYPEQLRGEEIPLGARIFAVADALDAITSDRPYRKSRPFAAALEEIKNQAGRQFDPAVVKTFLDVPCETWKSIRSSNFKPAVGSAARPCGRNQTATEGNGHSERAER
ncbi:MAG: HD domain-containing phosphohydrolase, partial [Terriglobia bacterium]